MARDDEYDYADFIDRSREVHTKLAANLAKAAADGEKRVREQLGLPPKGSDRTSGRMPNTSDLLFDLGRLHLEFVDRLADLTKDHAPEVQRVLEGLLSRVPRQSGTTAPRIEIDAYDLGLGGNYEPSERTVRFRIRTDGWKPDAPVSVRCKPFRDLESGEEVKHDHVIGARIDDQPGVFEIDRGGELLVRIDHRVFRPMHAYTAEVQILEDEVVRRTIEVVLRILPKPALPVLEFRRMIYKENGEDKVRWVTRAFPITNDTGHKDATIEILPAERVLKNPQTLQNGPKFAASVVGPDALAENASAACRFYLPEPHPQDGAVYEATVRVQLTAKGRTEEVARLRLRLQPE